MIHKTAIVDNKAKVSNSANIGPYSVIGPNVEIGENVIIHSHVNISGNTKIGNGNKIYPNRAGSKYRFVMTEGPSKSGNIATSCAGRNCKYNFSNNTYTVLSTGKTYKAGESVDTRKAINP